MVRLLLGLLSIAVICLFTTLPFIGVSIHRNEYFNYIRYIFRDYHEFKDRFIQAKCVFHANIYMFLRSLVQLWYWLCVHCFKFIKMPYFMKMYFDRRHVGFGTWQTITFTLYFLFVRVQKFEDS